jgi:hypothetical protein
MNKLPELKAGVYRHYKNHLYQVFGYAHDANVEGRLLVIYIGLELEGAKAAPRLAARTVEDFFAWVNPDGSAAPEPALSDAKNVESGLVRRFTYVGPSWSG